MTSSEVAGGRDAFGRQEWADAFERLSTADGTSTLDTEDLERLAVAAYLVGEDLTSADVWRRAHQRHLSEGTHEGAARCAFWLAFSLMNGGDLAQAQGWIARAERVLGEANLDCVERGYLLLPAALQLMGQGKWRQALDVVNEMARAGGRFQDADLSAFGLLGRGQCLISLGRDDEGIAELDEVMVSVTAGEVSPITAGIVYCAVIDACRQVFDMARAQEWTDALTRWCASQPDLVPYRGQCLVHRSELMQLRGKWSDALEEAQKARLRLSDPPGQPAIGMAYYQLGELHRLRGNHKEAEEAYLQANDEGRTPEPGLALLRLDQGRLEAAVASSRRSVAEATEPLARAMLLPAHVEIMLAADDVPEARSAADDLGSLATQTDVPLLHALAARARGAALMASGELSPALDDLRHACRLWRDLDAPFEIARTRYLLALTCRRLGDEDSAQMELEAARKEFERLGAAPDLRRVEEAAPASDRSTGLTPREQELLALIATGKTNRAIAEELSISEKTVARHVSNIFLKLDLSTRAAATAYAYEHGLV